MEAQARIENLKEVVVKILRRMEHDSQVSDEYKRGYRDAMSYVGDWL